MTEWQDTGSVAPGSLRPSRVLLHYAALILGSTADSVLPPADDDSHTNLGLDRSIGALVTHPLEAQQNTSVFLEVATLTLGVRNDRGVVGNLPLAGETLETGIEWLRGRLSDNAGIDNEINLRDYPGFPPSPLAADGIFEPVDHPALRELSVWFGNGHALLEGLRPENSRMSQLRIWPHHLDLGGLIPLGGGADRMIGLGLSPGDENYEQPYFYCTPYPVPAADANRPELRIGHWHTDSFISAIATADELQSGQERAARRYVQDALTACRSLVG